MNVDYLLTLAMEAMPVEEFANGVEAHVYGVVSMALRLQEKEYETLLVEANNRYRGEGKNAADLQQEYDAWVRTYNKVVAERDDAISKLARKQNEYESMRHGLEVATKERNAAEEESMRLQETIVALRRERDTVQVAYNSASRDRDALRRKLIATKNEYVIR